MLDFYLEVPLFFEKFVLFFSAFSPFLTGLTLMSFSTAHISKTSVIFSLFLMSFGLWFLMKKSFWEKLKNQDNQDHLLFKVQKILILRLIERFKNLKTEGQSFLKKEESKISPHLQKKLSHFDLFFLSLNLTQSDQLPLAISEIMTHPPQAKHITNLLMTTLNDAEKSCIKMGVTAEGTVLDHLSASVSTELLLLICRLAWMGFSFLGDHGSSVFFHTQNKETEIKIMWSNDSIRLSPLFLSQLELLEKPPFELLRLLLLDLQPDQQFDRLEGGLHLIACLKLLKRASIRYQLEATLKGPVFSLYLKKS